MTTAITKHDTLARLFGLGVVIVSYGERVCMVRYCGHEGKQITTESFTVETESLSQF